MLGIGPKLPLEDINFGASINKYIQQNFPDSATEVAHVAESLTATRKQIYEGIRGNEEYANVKPKILKYVATLDAISKRFSFVPPPTKSAHSNSINIPFTFHEILDGHPPVSTFTPDLEIGSALLNLAALATRQAVDKKANNLVEACTLFREATGVLDYIAEQPQLTRLGSVSRDFSNGVLNYFARLMQAQAQMCLFEKGVQTYTSTAPDTKPTISPATIAQVAAGASELYGAASTAASESGPNNSKYLKGAKNTSFDWLQFADYQRVVSLAAANMWWGRSQFDAHKYGMEILYLSFAVQFANQVAPADARIALTLPPAVAARKDLAERVERRRSAAINDNNVVYFDHVPTEGPAVPAKIMATPVKLEPVTVEDPYSRLVRPEVIAAANKLRSTVDDMLTHGRVALLALSDEARTRLNELGLPARVADTAGAGIPDEVWNAVTEAGGAGGVKAMEEGVAAVQTVSANANKEWSKVMEEVDEEEKRDQDLKQRYPGKVSSVDSKDLNAGIKTELARIKEMLDQAAKADESVRREIALARGDFALLSSSRAELNAALPASESSTANSAEKDAVKRKLAELSLMLRTRDETIATVEAVVKKWSETVISRLADGAAAADIENEIKPQLALLDLPAATAAQATCLQGIVAACAALDRAEGAAARADARKVFLTRITTAANTCRKVRAHAAEGARFYEELMREVIGSVAAQASDFVAARDLERRMTVEQIARAYAGLEARRPAPPVPTAAPNAPPANNSGAQPGYGGQPGYSGYGGQVAQPAPNTGYSYGYGSYGYGYGQQQ